MVPTERFHRQPAVALEDKTIGINRVRSAPSRADWFGR